MARFLAMLLPERSNFGLNELLDGTRLTARSLVIAHLPAMRAANPYRAALGVSRLSGVSARGRVGDENHILSENVSLHVGSSECDVTFDWETVEHVGLAERAAVCTYLQEVVCQHSIKALRI